MYGYTKFQLVLIRHRSTWDDVQKAKLEPSSWENIRRAKLFLYLFVVKHN